MEENKFPAEIRDLLRAQCAELRQFLSAEQLDELKAIPKRQLSNTHWALGMTVRNEWLYHPECKLMNALRSNRYHAHADSVSEVIIDLLWRQLHDDVPNDVQLEELLHRSFIFRW